MGLQIVSPSEQIKSVSFAHSAGTTKKTPLLINGRLLVPLATAGSNELNTFVHTAEFTGVAKATGAAWSVGDLLYWDDTAKNLTKTVGSNTKVGYCLEAALSADAVSGKVLLTAFSFGA